MYTTGNYYSYVQPYVYNNWYLLFVLDDCLSVGQQTDIQSSKKNNKYQLLHTYGCTY
jgi:hypothetical protein